MTQSPQPQDDEALDPRVYSAMVSCGGVWPADLVSGVMFYDGFRVTLRDFLKAGGTVVSASGAMGSATESGER